MSETVAVANDNGQLVAGASRRGSRSDGSRQRHQRIEMRFRSTRESKAEKLEANGLAHYVRFFPDSDHIVDEPTRRKSADSVAKLPKCPPANFPQIDETS